MPATKEEIQRKMAVRRERFAQEYVAGGCKNASEAYRRANPNSRNWKPTAVHEQASRTLKEPDVQARIGELQAELKDKLGFDAAKVLLEQYHIAVSDIRELFDEDGNLLPVDEIPPNMAAAIASIKTSTVAGPDSKGITTITEIKLWNKNTALESLFKNKGLYLEDNAQKKMEMTPEERQARIDYLIGKMEGKNG